MTCRLPYFATIGFGIVMTGLVTPGPARGDGPAPTAEGARPPLNVRLSESSVVGIAASEAPSVLAARHDAEAADAQHVAGERARLPDLVVSARYTRLSALPARFRRLSIPFPDGSEAALVLPQLLNAYAARAAIVVPVTDAWLGLAASARALGDAAIAKRLELEATRARITYEARVAFLLYRRARGARGIATSALEVASAQAKDQGQRVDAGTVPPSSILTFETALHTAVARLRLAEAEVVAAEAAVRAFLPESLASLPLEIDEDPAAPVAARSIDDSPLVRAAEMAVRAGDASAEAEWMAMLPHVSLIAGADVSAPNPRAFAADSLEAVPAWDVTVQLDWSLSALTTGTARHDRAIAERESLRARVVEVRRQLEAQRVSAAAAKESARARVAAARAAVATATRLAEARRNELAAGAATPLDTTTAENERVRAELEQMDAELDLRLADARLALVFGHVAAPGLGHSASAPSRH